MKKHALISIGITLIIVSAPIATFAAKFILPVPFGGQILSTTIPAVTCTPFIGTPVILSNNVLSLGSAFASAGNSNQGTANQVSGVINGLYGAIPYYAKTNFSSIAYGAGFSFLTNTPKVGQWILGTANAIPEFNNCMIGTTTEGIPFPVKDTSNYRTSSYGPSL